MSHKIIPAWTNPEGTQRASDLFTATFDFQPTIVAGAPGRVNLIGEHTDYNDGLCLPIALEHRTFVALRPRTDSAIRLVSDQGSLWEGDIADIRPGMPASWVNYAAGPAWALGISHGFDAAFVSCVPLGAGLSSSAAIECATAIALSSAAKSELVAACIRAENEVANAPTGGMDQTVSVWGKSGYGVAIDFHSHTHEHVEVDFSPYGLSLLVIDTRAEHKLSDGQYGNRRDECEQACQALGISTLRNAQLDHLDKLPPLLAQRARHVISENARVTSAIAALKAHDYTRLGELFNESHASLRDDFEVSCPELDCVVTSAVANGAWGARMTGGGFGGSAIALVPTKHLSNVVSCINEASVANSFPEPDFLIAQASNGAEKLAAPEC